MRRSLLLASLVLPPLLASPALAQQAAPAPAALTAPDDGAVVRVRSGQHPDRGRVVLHLGRIPPYSLRRVGQDYEVRLRGRHQLDLAALRRLREVSGAEFRQDSEETVLLLRVTCDCVAESGVTDGGPPRPLPPPRLPPLQHRPKPLPRRARPRRRGRRRRSPRPASACWTMRCGWG
jgi:hypothetical protein